MGTTTLLSFEEFERLPDEPGKDELLDGEWFHLPPAFRNHMVIVHRLHALLTRLVNAEERVFVETGYKIGARNWLVPDVSLTHPNQPGDRYFEGAPALAIEVISESNTARQIDRKRKIYLQHGALEVWVFYPDTQSVWLYRGDRAQEFTGELRSDVLPGLRIDLQQIFRSH